MADLAPLLAAPDDDGRRLVYADQVGGERGELIVVQCALAARGLPRARELALRRRARELLTQHAGAWASLPDGVGGFEFRRGFVEGVTADARWLQRHAGALASRAPLLRHLELTGLRAERAGPRGLPEELVRLMQSAASLPGLVSLKLTDASVEFMREFAMSEALVAESRSDALPGVLANLGLLRRLRSLELEALTRVGLGALLEHPDAAGLDSLCVRGTFGTRTTQGLLRRQLHARPTRLQVIDVPPDGFRAPGAFENPMAELVRHPLLSRVTDLEVRRLRSEALRVLLDSPVAPRLRRLAAAVTLDEATLELLLTSPSLGGLEELCLRSPPWPRGERPGPEGARALARFADATALPALRVLRLNSAGVTDELAGALLASPLARQLVELDLRGNGTWLSGARAAAWRAQTDTELHLDPPAAKRP